MESLEIGMPWMTSSSAPQVHLDGHNINSTSDQQGSSPLNDSRAGPMTELSATTSTINDEGTHTDKAIKATVEAEGGKPEEAGGDGIEEPVKPSKRSKKRKSDTMVTDQLLDRFGPPRQSIRTRIKVEFNSAPEPPQSVVSPSKPKKSKKHKVETGKAVTATSRPVVGQSIGVGNSSEQFRTRKGAKKAKSRSISKSQKSAKKEQPSQESIHPSMLLTDADIHAEEIVAYQPGSLEGMAAPSVETGNASLTLEQRLQAKKRKSRKVQSVKVREDSDKEIPLENMSRIVAPEPIKPGIRASTFARVMRLVADLPPCEAKPKRVKRRLPDHRPPVWAQVCQIIRIVLMVSLVKSFVRHCRTTEHSNLGSISAKASLLATY